MPLLSRAKRRVGHELGSAAMNADAKQSQFAVICRHFSERLLLNAALGWWWADPLAALIMEPIIAREVTKAFAAKIAPRVLLILQNSRGCRPSSCRAP